LRHIAGVCHLPGPTPFSLPTTFNLVFGWKISITNLPFLAASLT
jgi:hypothetical protein